jgi:putative transcriptional regulator
MSEQPRMIKSQLKLLMAERNVALLREGQPPYTQRRVAKEAGIALSVISGLASNRSRRIDYDTLDKLCRYFSCLPGDLIAYVPDEES